MKIRRASIEDLMKFLNECYENKHDDSFKCSCVLDIMSFYYSKLSRRKTIVPICGDYIDDWCDLDQSPVMDSCPDVSGIIVYRHKGDGSGMEYGILHQPGGRAHLMTKADQAVHCYILGGLDDLIKVHFYHEEWEGWGAPTKFFKFLSTEYYDCNCWELGDRMIFYGDPGRDVRQLQKFIKLAYPELQITSWLDEPTLDAINDIRAFLGFEPKEWFKCDEEGEVILEYLTGKQVNY